MNQNTFMIIVGVLLIAAMLYRGYITIRLRIEEGTIKYSLLDFFEQELLMLFLHAEKQGWVGADKMTWVIERVVEKMPEIVQEYFEDNREELEAYIQEAYNDFKDYITVLLSDEYQEVHGAEAE